jgi:hypothetical protein
MAPRGDFRMVSNPSKASAPRSDPSEAMIDLAQSDKRPLEPEVGASTGAEVELAVADLVTDANGEVVIFNDSGFRTLALHADSGVVESGRVAMHVTAGGEDVSGFNYVTFEDGMTVYYPEGLNVSVER